jgi:hypothetical protein
VRRLVAAQVASSHFATHNLARASNLDALGHGCVRFQFLLHKSSFCSSEVGRNKTIKGCISICVNWSLTEEERQCSQGRLRQCVTTQVQSPCSVEGAEKPVSGADPACETHYIIGCGLAQPFWPLFTEFLKSHKSTASPATRKRGLL